jgi:hypothetical protein
MGRLERVKMARVLVRPSEAASLVEFGLRLARMIGPEGFMRRSVWHLWFFCGAST